MAMTGPSKGEGRYLDRETQTLGRARIPCLFEKALFPKAHRHRPFRHLQEMRLG
jgi:hypothetical protein